MTARTSWRPVMPAGACSRMTSDGAYVKVWRHWQGGYRVTVHRDPDGAGIGVQTHAHSFPRVSSHRLDR